MLRSPVELPGRWRTVARSRAARLVGLGLLLAAAIWATTVSIRSELNAAEQRIDVQTGSVRAGEVPGLVAPGGLRRLVDHVVAREHRLPRFVTLTFDDLNATLQVVERAGGGWRVRNVVWNGRRVVSEHTEPVIRNPTNNAWSPYEVDLDAPARIIAGRSELGLGDYRFSNAGVFKRALPITDGVGIIWVINFQRGERTVQVIANAAGAVLRVGAPLGS
jgi:hypothetical protein